MELKKITRAMGWSCKLPLGHHVELKGRLFGTTDSPLITWENYETT